MIHLGLDIASGEKPLEELLLGVIEALGKNNNVKVSVIGDEKRISDFLKTKSYDEKRLFIIHSSDTILMTDDPLTVCRRKPRSSLMVGLQALKYDKIDCFFSPGNTGATLTGSLLTVGRIPGIKRPAIACPLPTDLNKKVALFLDGGANVDCTALYLKQFAQMGSIYYQKAFNVEKPRIALLNVGEESGKGNQVTKQAFEKIKQTSLNFIGNIEPREFFEHRADVAVCDGFIGNIFLKTAESTVDQINGILSHGIRQTLLGRIAGYMMLRTFRRIKREMNASNFGAAPLLGVAKPVFIGHGKTDKQSIINAIPIAVKFVQSNCIDMIKKEIVS